MNIISKTYFLKLKTYTHNKAIPACANLHRTIELWFICVFMSASGETDLRRFQF